MLMSGIVFLHLMNSCDFSPRFEQSMRAFGQVRFYHLMKSAQSVTGNRRIHVMFDVEVHVPVEKLDDRIGGKGAAAESRVSGVILESNVLGVVAKKEKPRAVKGGQGKHDGDHPPTVESADSDDRHMASQNKTSPAGRGTAGARIGWGKQRLLPFSAVDSASFLHDVSELEPDQAEIDEARQEPVFDHDSNG